MKLSDEDLARIEAEEHARHAVRARLALRSFGLGLLMLLVIAGGVFLGRRLAGGEAPDPVAQLRQGMSRGEVVEALGTSFEVRTRRVAADGQPAEEVTSWHLSDDRDVLAVFIDGRLTFWNTTP